MTPEPPLFISPLPSHIPPGLHELKQKSARDFTRDDKHKATALLAEALNNLLDTVFTQLLNKIAQHYGDSGPAARVVSHAQHTVDDIKHKIDHYLGWIVNFLSDKRLVIGIRHYDSLVHQLDDRAIHFVGFPIPPELANRASHELEQMKSGERTDATEGVELLIEFLELSVDPVVRQPLELMEFNYFVQKTLNGVLHLALNHVRKMLRKLPDVLPAELMPLLAQHMETFLAFNEDELEQKLAGAPEPKK